MDISVNSSGKFSVDSSVDTIDIRSLPSVRFAHAYQADSYRNRFPVMTGVIEVSCIVEGELYLKTGAEELRAGEGDILCLLHAESAEVCAPAFHAHHTVSAALDWEVKRDSLSGLLLPAVTPAALGTDEIRRIIDQLVYQRPSFGESPIRSASLFLSILCEIDRCSRSAGQFLSGEMVYADKARKYIGQHIHEAITQAEVAAHLGISPGYLCSVFKKAQGISLMQYINRTKLTAIHGLMETEHLKLYEAAALYGYTDANYVSRLYRKLYQHNISDRPQKP